MRPDEQQTTVITTDAPTDHAVTWYREAVLYQLDAVDVVVLILVGVCASALCYLAVERFKELAPNSSRRTRVTAPFVCSLVVTSISFPLVFDGLGGDIGVGLAAAARYVAAVLLLGAAGGLTATGAYRIAGELIDAAVDRLASFIRGSNGAGNGDRG